MCACVRASPWRGSKDLFAAARGCRLWDWKLHKACNKRCAEQHAAPASATYSVGDTVGRAPSMGLTEHDFLPHKFRPHECSICFRSHGGGTDMLKEGAFVKVTGGTYKGGVYQTANWRCEVSLTLPSADQGFVTRTSDVSVWVDLEKLGCNKSIRKTSISVETEEAVSKAMQAMQIADAQTGSGTVKAQVWHNMSVYNDVSAVC